MIILNEEEVLCNSCGITHKIHEYVGLEGAWYTSHYCEGTPLQGERGKDEAQGEKDQEGTAQSGEAP